MDLVITADHAAGAVLFVPKTFPLQIYFGMNCIFQDMETQSGHGSYIGKFRWIKMQINVTAAVLVKRLVQTNFPLFPSCSRHIPS